jgi:hypothetical protein
VLAVWGCTKCANTDGHARRDCTAGKGAQGSKIKNITVAGYGQLQVVRPTESQHLSSVRASKISSRTPPEQTSTSTTTGVYKRTRDGQGGTTLTQRKLKKKSKPIRIERQHMSVGAQGSVEKVKPARREDWVYALDGGCTIMTTPSSEGAEATQQLDQEVHVTGNVKR